MLGPHTIEWTHAPLAYRGTAEDDARGTPSGPDVPLLFVTYPILSSEHPRNVRLRELQEEYEGQVPPELYPQIESFRMVVRTRRFATVGDKPMGIGGAQEVIGLIPADAGSALLETERTLLLEQYPELEIDRLLVLEEGVRPPTGGRSRVATGASVAVVGLLWGIVILARRLRGGASSAAGSDAAGSGDAGAGAANGTA